jgi:hypothetical protein
MRDGSGFFTGLLYASARLDLALGGANATSSTLAVYAACHRSLGRDLESIECES